MQYALLQMQQTFSPMMMKTTCSGTYRNCCVGQKAGAISQAAGTSTGPVTFYPPCKIEIRMTLILGKWIVPDEHANHPSPVQSNS